MRSIDVCIPAHNEASVIEETVSRLRAALRRFTDSYTISVAENGSRDGTAQVASRAGARVIRIDAVGKGRAIITAAAQSKADYFAFIDADLSADPDDIERLVASVAQGECDIAIGSRLLDVSRVERAGMRTISSRLFNSARRALIGIAVEDTQCGLKVMNARGRNILVSCVEYGWFFDIEFLAYAERAGLRIREMPIRWVEVRYPGRKNKLRLIRDGFLGLVAMVRIRRRLVAQLPVK